MSPDISFHFNAADKLTHACKVLRKARALGHRVLVRVPGAELVRLDQSLWTMSALAFLPHARPGDPLRVLAHSPIRLDDDPSAVWTTDLLLNLMPEMPPSFERYKKVIEIVGLSEEDRAAARQRWRRYRDQGHEPQRHDLAAARA